MGDPFLRTSVTLRHSIYVVSVKCFFIFYILVGLPGGFQVRFLPIYFRKHGMSLAQVGLYRLLVLPWLLKGLWARYIDRHTDVRIWLKISLLLLVLLCVVAAQFPPTETIVVVTVLFLLNLITSVQDTAVDTLILDAFTPSQLLIGNVAQSVGERVGSIISGGVFSWYINFLDWSGVFYIMAALYGFGLLTSHILLPDWYASRSAGAEQLQMPSVQEQRSNFNAVASTNSQVTIVESAKQTFSNASMWMIVFVLFYKIGEVGVLSLFPLFLVDKGIDASQIGLWLGIIGQSVAVVGSTATAFYSFTFILGPLTVLMIIRAVCVVISWMTVVSWSIDPKTCFGHCTDFITLAVFEFTNALIKRS
ncbi:major facilitator superfamily domain-containing protein 3 [Elysia marginata]|uniref:Major facilitator superfamily domain-containing protein 3 n=1 Tax=Elysia marginata TaxID=1093978 RepID=A0AAV4G538_9GAST|nr:major facilitator superfamily domain-containing protein 3 [Elysia marginata]